MGKDVLQQRLWPQAWSLRAGESASFVKNETQQSTPEPGNANFYLLCLLTPSKSFLQWRIPVRLNGNRNVVAPSKDTIRDARERFYDDYFDNSRNSKA